MQINEFIETTSKIEDYYGKEYTNEQRQIMFDELEELDIDRYRKLVSVVLRKCKFLPKIVDFIEANKETPYSQQEGELEKVECKKCNSTGYIVYTKLISDGDKKIPHQYVAVCNCGNAKQYKGWEVTDNRYKSEFYTPMIGELGLEN